MEITGVNFSLKRISFLVILLTSIVLYTCSSSKGNVVFDSSFKGARLDSVSDLGNDRYIAHISPSFEPVNKSPWFAFGISSTKEKQIEVVLNYGVYKHRYTPKLSNDKKTWKKIEKENIEVDTVNGTALLKLSVTPNQLFVSAQEIESSVDTYLWIDSLLLSHPKINKIIAGKTALNKNLYSLEIKNTNINNAIVLIARQHPPEVPGGTIGFKAFFETIMANTKIANDFRKKFNIYTFPLLNPDGADLGNWRHNANGADLNRDWVDFKQPETKTVKDYFENKVKKGQNLRFMIDFHTSYSGPYFLILDSINELKTQKITAEWITNIERDSNFKLEARRRSQELPYCYNYFFNTFGCEGITYEDGDEIDRKIIKERAKVFAKELMKTLLKIQL